MKILLSAYACEPGRGSESGVGWNMAKALAREHQVWVLTSHTHQHFIDAELEQHPDPNLRVAYVDPFGWILNWQTKPRGVYVHYYLWQIWAYVVARKLHRKERLDVAHHLTYMKYSMPSFVSLLPIPFFMGPVGGGESCKGVCGAPRMPGRDRDRHGCLDEGAAVFAVERARVLGLERARVGQEIEQRLRSRAGAFLAVPARIR